MRSDMLERLAEEELSALETRYGGMGYFREAELLRLVREYLAGRMDWARLLKELQEMDVVRY